MTIRSDTPATLDVAALRHLMDSGSAPRLIDVRTPGEFETAHVPGSVNVPLDLLREHRERLRAHLDGSEREQVVLVCRSGQRAAQAAAALAGAGPVGPRVLEGGSSPGRVPARRSVPAGPAGSWNVRYAWWPDPSC